MPRATFAAARSPEAALSAWERVLLDNLKTLRTLLADVCRKRGVGLLLALPRHCGDNAAMIAGLAGTGRGILSPAAFDLDIDPSWPSADSVA